MKSIIITGIIIALVIIAIWVGKSFKEQIGK